MTRYAVAIAAALSGVPAALQAQDVNVTALIGAKTVDARGAPLGRIENVLLHEAGGIAYAVLSFAHGIGLEDKRYSYPLNEFAPGGGRGEIAIEAETKVLLKQAGKRMLPLVLRLYDPNAIVADPPYVRASELLHKRIIGDDGSPLGEVEDLVLNLASGRLRYVVTKVEGKRFGLPPSALAQVKIHAAELQEK